MTFLRSSAPKATKEPFVCSQRFLKVQWCHVQPINFTNPLNFTIMFSLFLSLQRFHLLLCKRICVLRLCFPLRLDMTFTVTD